MGQGPRGTSASPSPQPLSREGRGAKDTDAPADSRFPTLSCLCSPLLLRERGWGRWEGAQRLPDRLQYRVAAQKDIVIPEPQYLESFGSQPGIAFLILRRLEMLAAIRLNDQSSTHMHEIDDVIADRLLAAEFLPVQSMAAQVAPEERLGVGHLPAQLLCELDLFQGFPLSPTPLPRGERG